VIPVATTSEFSKDIICYHMEPKSLLKKQNNKWTLKLIKEIIYILSPFNNVDRKIK